MLSDHLRKQRERTWRMLHRTSILAACVLLVILIAIDISFRFASSQLNITIALVAVFLLILLRLDTLLHRMVMRVRRFRK
jgi:membrane protein YdbS with pleckstrin-like domain